MFTRLDVIRYMTTALMCGFGLCAAFNMAKQDTMGLEGYIVYVNHAWVDTPVWLGYLMMMLFTLTVSGAYRKVIKKKDTSARFYRMAPLNHRHGPDGKIITEE
jgi:hypothetical protein